MSLANDQIQGISELACQVAGRSFAGIRDCGSSLDDYGTGGELDLMLELSESIKSESINNPALIAAQMAARISRIMRGRKAGVLLSAPNLMRLAIHDVALRKGKLTLEPKIALPI